MSTHVDLPLATPSPQEPEISREERLRLARWAHWLSWASLVSHHVRALKAAGHASSQRDGKMVIYQLTDSGHALLAAASPAYRTAR